MQQGSRGCQTRQQLSRPGVTLLELLVVIGILSMLIALLLPAVQKAVGAARAVQCQSNLRQLAFAVHAYEEVNGVLPLDIQCGEPDMWAPLGFNSHFSIHAQLLPYLGNEAVYDLLNFDELLPQVYAYGAEAWSSQATAAEARISLFLCPSDSATRVRQAPNSYRGAWGVGPSWAQTAKYIDSGNGLFAGKGVSYAKTQFVDDGLQFTAMFSERVVGGEGGLSDVLSVDGVELRFATADEAARVCAALSLWPENAGLYSNSGKYWLFTGMHQTLYNHSLPPNAGVYDCLLFSSHPPTGASAARSLHPEGVHVAFGDASCRFISDSIDISVWRALGSRDGGELVLSSMF